MLRVVESRRGGHRFQHFVRCPPPLTCYHPWHSAESNAHTLWLATTPKRHWIGLVVRTSIFHPDVRQFDSMKGYTPDGDMSASLLVGITPYCKLGCPRVRVQVHLRVPSFWGPRNRVQRVFRVLARPQSTGQSAWFTWIESTTLWCPFERA